MAETTASRVGAPLDLTALDRIETGDGGRGAREPRFGEGRVAEPVVIDVVAAPSRSRAEPAARGVTRDETPALVLGSEAALSSTPEPVASAGLHFGSKRAGRAHLRRARANRRPPTVRSSRLLGTGSYRGRFGIDAALRNLGRWLSLIRSGAEAGSGSDRMSEANAVADRGWADAHAPSAAAFEALGSEAFARLPEPFRASCAGVAILVQEWPDEGMLRALELESPYDLLGLYDGVDLTQASGFDAPTDLNRIYLFRRPLLDYWAEHEETLGHLITHVLVHEIGHHLGLSDADMEAIEAAAR